MALNYYKNELKENAQHLASKGKGILAVDESTKTVGKRLAGIGVENTEENRKAYRGMLFTTEGLGKYISGAILFEETLFQSHQDGESMVQKLNKLGIIPGIKVDKGLNPLPGGGDVETFCSGLDGLVERAAKYYEQGARFAKWRAVLQITEDGCPSKLSIQENAWGLARYARSVQESGLVPIIEPEILMDGDHTIEKTAEVQEEVIKQVYIACQANGVFLEGTLLKPSMTVNGAECQTKADPMKVAEMTIRTMERCVPASVPGIVFLGFSAFDLYLISNSLAIFLMRSLEGLLLIKYKENNFLDSLIQFFTFVGIMFDCRLNNVPSTSINKLLIPSFCSFK